VPDRAGDAVPVARKPDPGLRHSVEPAAIELDMAQRRALGGSEPMQQTIVRLDHGAELSAERGEAEALLGPAARAERRRLELFDRSCRLNIGRVGPRSRPGQLEIDEPL